MKDNSPIISYIAIVMSFFALISVWIRFGFFRLSDASFIISVLSILVTTLIGWNIWQLINIGKIQKELLKQRKESEGWLSKCMADVYSCLAYGKDTVNSNYYFILHILKAIKTYSDLYDIGECNKIIDTFFEYKDTKWNLDNEEKKTVKNLFLKIRHQNEIFQWKRFSDEILKISDTHHVY